MLSVEEKLRRNYLNLVKFSRTSFDSSTSPEYSACIAWSVDPTLCKSFGQASIPKATASHTLSRHFLKDISTSGYVSYLTLDAASGLKKDKPYVLVKEHINSMSTFYGFCGGKDSCEHDFYDIDNVHLNRKNIFKFIYRELGRRIVFLRSEIEHIIKNRESFISVLKDYDSDNPELDFNEYLNSQKLLMYAYKTGFMNISNAQYIFMSNITGNSFYDIQTITLKSSIECYGISFYNNYCSYRDVGIYHLFSFIIFHSDKDGKQCVTIIEPRPLKNKQKVFNDQLKQLSKLNKNNAFHTLLKTAVKDPYHMIAFKNEYSNVDALVNMLNSKS